MIQFIWLISVYLAIAMVWGIEAAQMPGRCTIARSGGLHYTIVAAHYKFMCDKAQRFVDDGRIEKAMRWLGFLQGALWRCGRFTLNELKKHSRPDGSI